jgi:hypothetical protein
MNKEDGYELYRSSNNYGIASKVDKLLQLFLSDEPKAKSQLLE